ncbi:unnamed protein product [Paramecium pentaurelia]|uniref:Uncharacterized protein n=1 Tax=Paramecium pentaurelia TaxID=43138 RepID=A0A8S1VNT8_9CILI|nr:unnamed protein product [Paramecium pentaurelia]
MYENDVIQVTSSYDLTNIFWDRQLIVNRIDKSKEKQYQAAVINFLTLIIIRSLKPRKLSIFKIDIIIILQNRIFKRQQFLFILFLKIELQEYMIQDKEYQDKKPINTTFLDINETELIIRGQIRNVEIHNFQQNKVILKLSPCPKIGFRFISISQNTNQIIAADLRRQCRTYMVNNMDLTEQNLVYKFEAHQLILAQINTYFNFEQEKFRECKQSKQELFSTLYGIVCDSEYIITAISDLFTKIWQNDSAALLRILKGHKQGVTSFSINDIAID